MPERGIIHIKISPLQGKKVAMNITYNYVVEDILMLMYKNSQNNNDKIHRPIILHSIILKLKQQELLG